MMILREDGCKRCHWGSCRSGGSRGSRRRRGPGIYADRSECQMVLQGPLMLDD